MHSPMHQKRQPSACPAANFKHHKSMSTRTVITRSQQTLRLFSLMTVLAMGVGFMLSGSLALAQANLFKFDFEDAPGTTTTSDTSLGGASVALSLKNGANAATDYHGAIGSGVSGLVSGKRALDFSSTTAYGTGAAGPNAIGTSAAFGLGSVTSFIVTEWIKPTALPAPAALDGRLFVLGPNALTTDVNAADTIGIKIQAPNQINFHINNGNPTATAIFPANLPLNTWLFIAFVYDGSNVRIYQGSETAAATLISTTAAPGLTCNLGATSTLSIGNRGTRVRPFAGFIDDVRFYTNSGTANFVEDIRQQAVGGAPTVTGIYPDGSLLQQATNKFVFTASSPSGTWGPGKNITNITMVLNGVDVSSQLVLVTNGSPTNISASFTGLKKDQTNTVSITVRDASGLTGTAAVTFDTFSPDYFTWEAEEFDHDSGQYIDAPLYTSSQIGGSYNGLDSVEGVDTHKGAASGPAQASDYRAGAADAARTQTPAVTDTQRQKFLDAIAAGDSNVVDHIVGFWSSAEWQNYTKTFPAGSYNVYGRLSCGASATLTFSKITSGQGTSTQTTTNLGTFSLTGNNFSTYQWIPLRDGVGNLASINLSGVNTVRVTSGGGANANFYMLVPANTNLPSISGVYPNGLALFQSTNKLVFTVSSAVSTISTNSITLQLNGTNVSSNLVFNGSPTSWNVSYTGLLPNQTYTAVISVTDANGGTATSTLKLDTWNPVFQFEAEDFDFNGGQYIDNPTPSSYAGQVGVTGIDEFNNNAVPPYAGASASNKRPNDPIATTLVTDAHRQQFINANASDYNVGFLGPFFWQNYTRTWPSGKFNVYGRMASGAINPTTLHMGLDEVTAGWGTATQFSRHVGAFTIPTSGGYSAYLYVPLMDKFGNYANMTLGGTNTFRTTFAKSFGTNFPAEFGLNVNFYMLVAARTDLPRIDDVYPDGSVLMQPTNKFSFVASSPTYGINSTNIQVTLNGINISSNLVITGSSTNWNVSYPLQLNQSYVALISVTDLHGTTTSTTVSFDTFSPGNFTWEAEDYDFNPGFSPVSNSTGKRYIDNPTLTSSAAADSYFGQMSDLGIDVDPIYGTIHPGNHLYRSSDWISTEVTGDTVRQKYINVQQANLDQAIVDYDVYFWTNASWIDWTRTFPTGNFQAYARLAGAVGTFNLQLAQVTGGWGTASQSTQYLGTFRGVGTGFNNWQWVPLVNTNTGQPITLSLGGTNTLQMTADGNENANFFMLVPVATRASITASRTGASILLSFPTEAGFSYTVSYKNNLTDANWTVLGTVNGDGSVKSLSDGTSQASRFYRLSIQ
ncbi:MAG: hypothetical protein JWQ71_3631 [Pedosphaera sp.]|nr:hypothetical protein [Pedosphaera sp.]